MDQLTLVPGRVRDPFRLTEHELMNWTISYLSLRGHFVQRINSGKSFVRDNRGKIIRSIKLAEKGTPDVIGFHGRTGKFICVEVKVRPNKPEPAQIEFIENARRCGCIAAIVYSQEDVEQIPGI